MNSHDDDDQWLEGMRVYYLSRAGDKLDQLSKAVSGLEQSPRNTAAYSRLDTLLHNLIGSGGSYGLPEVSDAARQMLKRLKSCRQGGGITGGELMSDLWSGLDRLRIIFADASTGTSFASQNPGS
ncbi:MAG: Hpt domain-containing protein [Armatimonadota bacterium]|nr:Hpt domain-containing protein [Armatimonadota bacterium]